MKGRPAATRAGTTPNRPQLALVLWLGVLGVELAGTPADARPHRAAAAAAAAARAVTPTFPLKQPPTTAAACATTDRWLFIASTGRSGSSTIMHMLNQVPGIMVAGENYGQLAVLAHGRDLVDKAEAAALHTAAWTSQRADRAKLAESVRTWLDAIAPLGTIRGFKEIRWAPISSRVSGSDDPLRVFRFLQESLPCSRMVFSYRKNLTRQLESSFHRKSKPDELAARDHDLRAAQATVFRDNGFLLPLEDFSPETFNKLLRWLGVVGCWFTDVLHTNGMPSTHKDGPNVGGHVLAGDCTIATDRWGPADNSVD